MVFTQANPLPQFPGQPGPLALLCGPWALLRCCWAGRLPGVPGPALWSGGLKSDPSCGQSSGTAPSPRRGARRRLPTCIPQRSLVAATIWAPQMSKAVGGDYSLGTAGRNSVCRAPPRSSVTIGPSGPCGAGLEKGFPQSDPRC